MPKLVIKEGPGRGDQYELSETDVTVGRDSGNTLRAPDKTVSRFHAKVGIRGGRCYVSDLKSHNGTFVNGERVRRRRLYHMDEIRLGNVVLIFLEDDVTDVDMLLRSQRDEPEITQTIAVDDRLLLEGVGDGSRSELITSNQRLLALAELSRVSASVRSMPSLFDLVIDNLKQTLNPDRVVPILREDDGTLLPYLRAKSGFERGLDEAGISKSVVEECLKNGVAVVSQRPRKPGDAGRKGAGGQHITSVLCAPLARRKPYGVLYCDRVDRDDHFERADIQYICSVAAQAAVVIETIRDYQAEATRARSLEGEVSGQYDLIGQSTEMNKVFEFIRRAAPTGASVLICGESGTGKELVARAIHYQSNRNKGPFEAVNCAAMSQTLIESELFGHVRGSFTGAISDRPGRFELAHKGTIFLDEVGSLPLDCQTKLLRVLEDGLVRRVGDVKDRTVDVRVIAATNEDLNAALKENRFREDLFYRLNVLRSDLPPLRERSADIEILSHHFLRLFSEKCGRAIEGYDPAVLHAFRRYAWPGNVRELKNVIERMVIMCDAEVLSPDLLPPELRGEAPGTAVPEPQDAGQPGSLRSLQEIERRYILDVLQKVGGNKKKAAEILGLDRSTLYAKLRRYNV